VDIAFDIIKTLSVAFLAAFFASKLSLQRYYAEKLLDRKIEQYVNITNALYDMKAYCHDAIDISNREGPEQINELQSKELQKKYYKASNEIRRVRDIGSLIVSQSSIDELQKLNEHLDEDEWVEHVTKLDSQLESVVNCLAKIIGIAKKDLKIKKAKSHSLGL
jgi:cell fate (sporulation/competence/biofilm development) regulator YlbF (YheA/YmcA/DUF963 family)